MNSTLLEVIIGEYRYIQYKNGESKVLRYDEEWRDTVGDNLICAMACEIDGLREEIKSLEDDNKLLIQDLQFNRNLNEREMGGFW